MTGTASLTDAHVGVIGVANLADGSAGVHGNLAHLAGGQADLSVGAFLGHYLSGSASGANHLAAAANLEFHVVDQGAQGDVLDGQAVAGLDVSGLAAHDGVAHLQAQRSQDVGLFAVGIIEQGDKAGTVGIVFDGLHGGGDAILGAAEIDTCDGRRRPDDGR